jgi:outer membrane protein TolC
MRDKHAPHDEFVNRLQSTLGHEVRRRNALAGGSRGWLPRFELKTAVTVAALMLGSMAIGGAVVAAAYQAHNAEQRDQLAAGYERRLDLAKRRLALAEQQLGVAEGQVSTGLGTIEGVLDARLKIAEAQSALRVLDLQIAEIRLTSREPVTDISAPLVSGRDFVTERLTIERTVPLTALEVEQRRLKAAEQKVQMGVSDPADVDVSRTRLLELQAGLETFDRKLDIRQRFLKKEYDAAMADLKMLEAEAEQRRKALLPRISLAQKMVQRVEQQVQVGMAQPVQRTEAQLRVMELQVELTKLDVDLVVVKKQIEEKRIK